MSGFDDDFGEMVEPTSQEEAEEPALFQVGNWAQSPLKRWSIEVRWTVQ